MFKTKGIKQTILPFDKDWESFYNHDLGSTEKKFIASNPEDFEKQGQEMAFNLFHQMAERVPAYKKFLSKNKIDPKRITKIEDLKKVPLVDKDNYLKINSLSDLCWDGKAKAPIISASSGSSGSPFFWPRSQNIEIETTYIYELFLKNIFEIHKYKTLLVSGFSMGIYIGGTFTLNCCMRLSQKGYPLTIVTPGINKDEIIKVIKSLSSEFEQVILCGYPPFVRDILDDGEKEGIDWKKLKLKFFFASESLSEDFRKYIFEKAGIEEKEYYFSSMNLYGTADTAIAGHETPLSTFIRKLFSQNPKECKKFFGTDYVPSLNQYYPFFKHLEIENGEIIFTSFNTEIPLLRYNIHDRGNILSYSELIKIAQKFGYSEKDIEKITGRPIWKLPYVYLYGRSDFSVTLYGLNVYTENIKSALEKPELIDIATGKFVMETKNREDDQSQYLEIHVEVRDGVKTNKRLENKFESTIAKTLKAVNLEYNHLYQAIKSKADPEVDLRKQGDSLYFSPATKQRWVVRS